MKIGAINYNQTQGEGSVTFTKDFDELHPTIKLDVLQDALHDLNEKYNEVVRGSRKKK
jgi:hypothetical protein